MLLLQILSPEEVDPSYDGRVNLVDSESVDISDPKNMKIKITRAMLKAYEEAMADFKADIQNYCSKRDVGYISLRTDEEIERVLFGDLLKVGIMS